MKKLDVTVLASILAATIIGAAVFVIGDIGKQPTDARPTSCEGCAKNFAPGQEAEDPTSAKDFAPGFCIGCDPKDDAPGQFNKKPIPD